jgi:hypothetical protein
MTANTIANIGRRDRTTECDLGEVGEHKSDDNGRNGALAGTNNLGHVDRDLAVGGSGRDDGAVGAGAVGHAAAAGGIWVSKKKS